MPWYEFACANDHVTEPRFSISENKQQISCPDCGEAARKQISVPATRRIGHGMSAVVSAANKTATEPDVVSSIPRGGASAGSAPHSTPVSYNPQHAKLPKPSH